MLNTSAKKLILTIAASASMPSSVIFAAESTRRSTRQLQAAGVTTLYKLPKFEGVGFALGREQVFANNARQMKRSYYRKSGHTGLELFSALKDYSGSRGCVPNLLIMGHGWGADGKKRRAIATGSASRDSGRGLYQTGNGASIEGRLKDMVERKEIKFCSDCNILLHACTIHPEFSKALALVSGCRVVSADYKVSPVDTNSGIYDHVWQTSAHGKFYEYVPNRKSGEVTQKTIGKEFIADLR